MIHAARPSVRRRGDGRATRMATPTRLRRAAIGNDEAEDRTVSEHLRGSTVHRHGAPEGRGVQRHQVRQDDPRGSIEGPGIRDVDVSLHFVAPLVILLDAGDPITLLGGVHVGCFELFGTDRVRAIRDLRGRRSRSSNWARPSTSSSPAWWPWWGWTRART